MHDISCIADGGKLCHWHAFTSSLFILAAYYATVSQSMSMPCHLAQLPLTLPRL